MVKQADIDAQAGAIVDLLKAAIDPIKARLYALEQVNAKHRVKAIEDRLNDPSVRAPLTSSEAATIDRQVTEISRVIRDEIANRMSAIESRLAGMESRTAAFAARPYVKFAGVWERGNAYSPGDAATHQGGLWICRKAATVGEPSKDFAGWQLAVKKGDAR